MISNLNKNFIFFLISNTISSLGDYIYDIAIIVYLYKLTGSSIVLGGFFIFQFLPTLIFTPIVGTLIDKLNKKRLIIVINLLRGIILLIILYNLSPIIIFLVTLILGICDELNRATNNAIIPQIVNQDKITKANSLLSLLDSVTMIIGPMIAGILMSITQIYGSVLVNSISFILSGIIMGLIKINNFEINIKKQNFFLEVKKGIKIIFKNKFIEYIILIWGLLLMGVGITGSFLIILITDYMGLSSNLYGWLTAAEGIGIAIGSLIIINNKNVNINNILLIKLGLSFLGTGALITALSNNMFSVLCASLITGLGASTAPVGIRSLLQTNIPKEMIGRVFTSVRFIVTSLRTLSISVFSVLAGYINLRYIFILAALMMFSGSFIAFLKKNILIDSIN